VQRTRYVAVLARPPGDPGAALQYGMNPSFNVWSEPGLAFADLMAKASEFGRLVDGEVALGVPAPLLPTGVLGAGWPDPSALAGQGAGVKLARGRALPDGRSTPYVVRWRGRGSCRLFGPDVIGERARTAQRVEVLVASSGGDAVLSLAIEGSDPGDPVRDVHVWLPGTEDTQPIVWEPYALRARALNGGRGPHTWRTLDWTRVNDYGRTGGNGSFVFDLEGRVTTQSPSQGTRRGVAPEYQVAFCNAVGADLHYQVPHRTDQMSPADYRTYVRDVLTRIRDGSPGVTGVNGGRPFSGLAPGLTVWLELSNEIWNPEFPVNGWMHAEANRKGITFGEQVADQITLVLDLADEVYSGPHAVRLARYVGGQKGNAGYLRSVLAALAARHGAGGFRIDAVGTNGYFGPLPDAIDGWMEGWNPETGACPECPTPEEVIAAAVGSLDRIEETLDQHRALADAWQNPGGGHPELALYEGGIALVPRGQPWRDAAEIAHGLPAMYYAYVDALIPLFVEVGVDRILWYSFMTDQDQAGYGVGNFGHWAAMDQAITLPVPDPYHDQGAPKAAAIYRRAPRRAP
jgi:hypothetical protein